MFLMVDDEVSTA